ncbi:MAG: TrkA family potassium uptake protein [Sinobacterium sp.]|nr:TrkA family potassium uptake protein [Sinobacterium sp.]
MNTQIAVIGLGRFGESLCLELTELGAEVLAIDTDPKAVNAISNKVSQAVIADITNERVTDELNLSSYHSVIIALSSDIGTSILATIILKESGVNNLWVKCSSDLEAKTLKKVGADNIINPEQMVANRISKQLISSHIRDFIDIGDGLALYELKICESLVNKKLSSLGLPKNIMILGLKQQGNLLAAPDNDYGLQQLDILILGGPSEVLQKLLLKL